MATRKSDDQPQGSNPDAEEVKRLADQFRAGVDISDEELAQRFTDAGYDGNQAMQVLRDAEASEAEEG